MHRYSDQTTLIRFLFSTIIIFAIIFYGRFIKQLLLSIAENDIIFILRTLKKWLACKSWLTSPVKSFLHSYLPFVIVSLRVIWKCFEMTILLCTFNRVFIHLLNLFVDGHFSVFTAEQFNIEVPHDYSGFNCPEEIVYINKKLFKQTKVTCYHFLFTNGEYHAWKIYKHVIAYMCNYV